MRLAIGNQTAFYSKTVSEPFLYALVQGFTAFEWFPDKKHYNDRPDQGFEFSDISLARRNRIRQAAEGMMISVHAPWQADPMKETGLESIMESLEFASDIDAGLVNIHLSDKDPNDFAQALEPVIYAAQNLNLRLSLENTPDTGPEECNAFFSSLKNLSIPADHVGLCFDMGHANLCKSTKNRYPDFLDMLDPEVPVIHLHVHENYGDKDSHLCLFTGPSASDDTGVRMMLTRLAERGYSGAAIMEQWPDNRSHLIEAFTRLNLLCRSHK